MNILPNLFGHFSFSNFLRLLCWVFLISFQLQNIHFSRSETERYHLSFFLQFSIKRISNVFKIAFVYMSIICVLCVLFFPSKFFIEYVFSIMFFMPLGPSAHSSFLFYFLNFASSCLPSKLRAHYLIISSKARSLSFN